MRNYNNYADMITFSRASSGTALAKISYGPEMLANGTFDDATGWTLALNTAVSGGVLNFINANFAATCSYQIGYTANTAVKISVDVSISSGRVEIWLGGTALGSYAVISAITTSGTYEAVVNSPGTDGNIYVRSLQAGTNATVDNLSVKPVLYDQPDGTLQLFNHPANKPRVEYDYQGNRLGLLMEQARTNLQTQSEGTVIFTAYQSADGTANAATAPDGTNNAMLLASTAGGNTRNRAYQNPVSLTGGVAYTLSGFFKKQNVNVISLRVPGGNDSQIATFDFRTEQWDTSVISAYNPQTTVKKYPNGWYRISLTGTPTATSSGYFLVTLHGDDANPNNQSPVVPVGDGVYIWGAQNEAGSFPTSYIPTSGATATRSVDTADISTSAFGFNSKLSGTLFMEGTIIGDPYNGEFGYLATLGSGVNDSRFLIRSRFGDAADTVRFSTTDAANTTVPALVTVGLSQNAKNAPHKIAGSIGGGQYLGAANGLTASTTYTGDLWTPSQLEIGRHGVAYTTTCHIKSLAYYPRRLTEAQIQKLTQVKAVPTLSLTFDGNSDSYLETSIHG